MAIVGAAACFAPGASAQPAPPQDSTETRIVVSGDGSVEVAPDTARLSGGVTAKAKTVKEAVDTTSKTMAAMTAALLQSGIAQKDIQTNRFSVQPVYAAPDPHGDQAVVGYSVSNQVTVKLHDIDKVGPTLDRLVAAGATNVGNVVFEVSDPSTALDKAREAAITDAKRKAELYARAAGIALGGVVWVKEESASAAPMQMRELTVLRGGAAPVPIATGEDTLRARVTVGFGAAH
ncbi:MAG TPA: SIMPL domain-containing protein [Stellaceae bacterium]|jgi:hypothetical protein|nr:SIMPL domain-containing protein [Stellaceae bacterium]